MDITLTEQEHHNIITSSIPPDVTAEARKVGIGWFTILHMLIAWGPAAAKILQDLIDSIRKHHPAPAEPAVA